MDKIKLVDDCNVPQYNCSSCYKCTSIVGTSMTFVKNRGCCWYFPKFNIHDIHRMVKSKEGLEVLERILKLPNVKLYNYYIHAKGDFDEEGYKKFLESDESKEEKYEEHDETMFFRTCPFVIGGEGCTIPARYRNYVCNFFICPEITEKLEKKPEFSKYQEEMKSYVHWVEWENESIRIILEEEGINLINNFDRVIEKLKELPLEEFEFRKLDEIEY
ncbi:MAG: hypothetical protein K5986_11565 [Clostridium sp.]|uniref:hypothetical protein n=1 Tax=Clostridium sp. DSM 8431 TaxID=1761781 RepID=UPI0008EBD867|nr:hypothetical protein [Clostridium sp. DSM 8431]MCR4945047.1 hypothetical protein [Clostridium sp.]SFU50822.1 hypothetical protein SAMN04487886_104325 [Clostridium sp. DSM 8431]